MTETVSRPVGALWYKLYSKSHPKGAMLERFYRLHDAWVTSKAEYINLQRLTVKLNLMLANSGTGPANDIDIFLYFPDGFELYDAESFPSIPTEPKPPEKPGVSGITSMLTYTPPGGWNFTVPKPQPTNVSAPRIRKTNSYEVRIHVGQLKHILELPLQPLYVVFSSFEGARSFSFHYTLVAANLPRPTEGDLHIIVKSKSPSRTEQSAQT